MAKKHSFRVCLCVVQADVAEQQQQQWTQPPSMNWHSFLEKIPSSAAQQSSPTSLQKAWQPSRNHARAFAELGGQVQNWGGIIPASKNQAAASNPGAPHSAEAAAPTGRSKSCLAGSLEPSFDSSHAANMSQPPDRKVPLQASMRLRQAGQEAAQLASSVSISGKSPQPSKENDMKRADQGAFDAASQSDEDCPTVLSVFDGL